MNGHPAGVTRRAAVLDARDAVNQSLRRTAQSLPRVLRVAAEADRRVAYRDRRWLIALARACGSVVYDASAGVGVDLDES